MEEKAVKMALPSSHKEPTAERSTDCPVKQAKAAHSACQPIGLAKVRKQNLLQCQRHFILVRLVFPG